MNTGGDGGVPVLQIPVSLGIWTGFGGNNFQSCGLINEKKMILLQQWRNSVLRINEKVAEIKTAKIVMSSQNIWGSCTVYKERQRKDAC